MNLLSFSFAVVLALAISACSSNNSDNPEPADPDPGDPDPGNPVPDDQTPPAQNPVLPGAQTLDDGVIGPIGGSGLNNEYSQFADSPFSNLDFSSGYFYFEDFEDNIFEHPGATANLGNFVILEFGPGFHDSVDNDDGAIDGTSLDGQSWFHDNAAEGVTWTFDASALGGQLPNVAGMVWTDGRGEITFEAYDHMGNLIDTISADHADTSFNGETAEDRFYGVVYQTGISAISLKASYSLTGIEIDHLQWGYLPPL